MNTNARQKAWLKKENAARMGLITGDHLWGLLFLLLRTALLEF
jgi:hypothetical protein